MVINFRTRLLLMIGGCIAAALFVLVAAIIFSVQQSIHLHTDRELAVSERVLLQSIAYRDSQLRQSALVLADDFGFRQALASDDEDTIVSALTNHAQRLNADLVMLLNPNSEVLLASHDIAPAEMNALRADMQQNDTDGAAMLVAEQELFQVVWVPIRAPHLLGWLALGFTVDNRLAAELQQLANSYVHFVIGRFSQQPVLISSAEPTKVNALRDAVALDRVDEFLVAKEKKGRWLAPLNNGNGGAMDAAQEYTALGSTPRGSTESTVHVLLTASLASAATPFTSLQQQLLVIISLTLLITVLVTLFASRRFVEPLRSLAKVAGAIAQGEYRQKISQRGNDEISTLAQALDHMQSAIAEREQEISYQSQHDLLTGLSNQRAFNSYAVEQLERDKPWTLVVLNIDNFRRLNEMFGRGVCDDILACFAQRLEQQAGANFYVARLQGDEFVLGYDGVIQNAEVELAQLLSVAQQSVVLNEVSYTVAISSGLAEAPTHAKERDELIRLAQFARNKAKQLKQSYAIYQNGEDRPYLRTLAISSAIPQAIRDESFTLVYQPQVDGNTHQLVGAEVLIRWQDKNLGFISPAEFIPLAEQSGKIFAITQWVLRHSLQQLAIWHQRYPRLQLSVNLSAADLAEEQLLDVIFGELASANVSASYLTIEVTESAVVNDALKATAQLAKLRKAGVKVAIDDYGTGYSSLAQLRGMPATELKIDRSFVMELEADESDRTIVESTIQMAHKLGLKVVAEGVEDEATAHRLASYGCDLLQGYWFSKPMRTEDFMVWAANNEEN